MPQAAIPIAALAITAIGTGLAVYGQAQQAQSAQEFANYNATIGQQNAQLQAELAARNASIQQQGAEYSAQAAMAQHQAALNDAAALADQARATERQGREEARRVRERNASFLSKQRARFAAAGVVGTEGTPLAVLADTAGKLELEAQDRSYESGLQARELDWRASLKRYQAGFSLLDAGLDRYQGQIAAWRGEVAQLGVPMAADEAELTRWSGATQATGYQMGAVGSLLSGAASMANSAYDFNRQGAFKKLPKSG